MRGFPGPPPHPPGAKPGPPGHPAHQGHPGQGRGRGGPPPQMQMQMQMPMRPRYESSHIVDLNATDKQQLDEAVCKKLLTTYSVYSIRKVIPTGKDKSTWAKAVVTEEALSQEDIAAQLRKLKESPKTISDKKGALFPNQQGQVNRLLDRLKNEEANPDFDWSLVQLDRRERSSNKIRETVLITVIVKRALKDHLSAMAIYHLIEKNKQERVAEMMRSAMPPQPQQGQPLPNPNDQPAPVVGIVRTNEKNDGNRGRSRSRSRQRPARYQSDSNSDTESDSDTASTGASTIGSSLVTSISSRSDERPRRYNLHNRRGRSHSRHRQREHQKKYYSHRSESPEPIFQKFHRRSHPRSPYVGEIAPIAPDAIIQAFQQGREEERAAAQHYLSQSQRPMIADEPSRAVIPAGRRELEYNTTLPRYPSRQYADAPTVEAPRHVESPYTRPAPRHQDPIYNDRHLDDLYEDDGPPVIIRDVRSIPQDITYRRHLSDAESYIARDPIRPRIPFTGLRPQIPQFRRHPFTPRSPPRYRYASSYSSDSAHT
ncbi:hypothetical protein DID88_007351 [Monilinia fructigena]|uniref:Uncharacterized protein n=2 Tax=Monilinia fructigena TaxID=38457 RepID=A0A395JD18_9HELO|nr:hypothetical protein DID88_007351 [Monilinia fructigena]